LLLKIKHGKNFSFRFRKNDAILTAKKRKCIMKERIVLVLSLILTVSGIVLAQEKATKTVTNADLEKFRQKRLQAERDYRENYRKRGMPSPEELERIEAERQRGLDEFARRAQTRRAENAGDIRERAAVLKNEMISIDAQIAYLRGQTNNQRSSSYLGGTVLTSPYGVIVPDYGRGGWGGISPLPGVTINPFPRRNPYGGRRFPPPFRGGYVVPLITNGDAEADELKLRLYQLEQVRAGLTAQWLELEDEARRAGVRID
jgi:hypothetical protein